MLPLPAVRTTADAAAALSAAGAFALAPGLVDAGILVHLDGWLLASVKAHRLAGYPVRQPRRRGYPMLLLGDGGGAVAAAVGAMARGLGSAVAPGAVLAELGAFVVSPGADAQELHPDRTEGGYVSSSAIDTPGVDAGGLVLWPGSLRAVFRDRAPSLLAAGVIPALQMPDQRAGAIVCYERRVWHHGQRHVGTSSADEPRRVLYFTAALPGEGGLNEGALHPRLCCLPLRHAPPVRMEALQRNASWFMCTTTVTARESSGCSGSTGG